MSYEDILEEMTRNDWEMINKGDKTYTFVKI
jgi:cell division protein FtsB